MKSYSIRIWLFSRVILLLVFIGFVFFYRGFFIEMFRFTKNLLNGDIKVILPYSTSKVEFENRGLRLVGDLCIPKGQGPFPTIVFLHGSNELGRNLPLYRILCKKFVQLNYVILSFDLRGYGESQDPDKFESPDDLDFVGDVRSAINYMLSLDKVNRSNINLVGHSLGAGVALAVASEDNRSIRKIVSISPGIRTGENKDRAPAKPGRIESDMMIDHIIPSELSERVFFEQLQGKNLIGNPHHPPILLINGSQEFDLTPDFLQDIYSLITPPKKYVIIEGADHYFGTRFDYTSPRVKRLTENSKLPVIFIFKKGINPLNELVEEIDNWLKSEVDTLY